MACGYPPAGYTAPAGTPAAPGGAPTALPDGELEKEYAHDFENVDAKLEKGALPDGLVLKRGKISGTPTKEGAFPITVLSKEYTITIKPKAQ
jgi:hypothetical protein